MDGAGVLFDETDPAYVAALMDGILSNPDLQDCIVEAQLAAVARLKAKDFRGAMLGFVDQILSRPRTPHPSVTFDFWQQFDTAQGARGARLVSARNYKALPEQCESRRMIINQWVPAAHKGDAIGDSARRVRTLLQTMAISPSSTHYRSTTLRDDVRPFADRSAARGDLTIFHYALPSR